MAKGDTKTNQYLDIAANGTRADLPTDTCCETRSQTLIRGVAERIMDLEDEVHEWEDNPDVADIVDTYADLQAYDTSTLTDKDIIRVLNDETHDGESTYYRYNKTTDSWTYIGSTGPKGGGQSDWAENDSTDPAYIKNRTHYEEKVATDIARGQDAFDGGTTAVTGYSWEIQQVDDYFLSQEISEFSDGDTIYAKYTYSVNGVEKSGEAKFTVTVEDGKYSLDSDMPLTSPWNGAYAIEFDTNTTFRWPVETVDTSATVYLTNVTYTKVKQLDAKYIPDTGGGVNVVQTTGTSTTDVMSQKATTDMVFGNADATRIQIGSGASTSNTGQVAIGQAAETNLMSVAIGYSATTRGVNGVAIGPQAVCGWNGSVALGKTATATAQGQVMIGSTNTTYGYNNSNYRLLSGVYDGQSDHDACTVGQLNAAVGNISTVLQTLISGTGATGA